MITLYGIPNCDSIKKAKQFLQQAEVEFDFYNYKKQAVTSKLLQSWMSEFGWEKVLNKRGTTYRQLSTEQKNNLNKDKLFCLNIN